MSSIDGYSCVDDSPHYVALPHLIGLVHDGPLSATTTRIPVLRDVFHVALSAGTRAGSARRTDRRGGDVSMSS